VARLQLRLRETDLSGVEEELRRRLYAFNTARTCIDDGRLLVLDCTDESGTLVGGAFGWSWGGTAFVDLLYVDEDRRGAGVGARLMAAVEDEARARGCHQVVLATHDFQAPGFYAKLGFVEVGRFVDYPAGGYQVQLVKRLD
jgi:GNAT superfamily N-acetyltransferase